MEPTALLQGLLERYSPTGQEAGASAFLVEAMRGLGFQAGCDPAGNPVGTRGEGPRTILLLGHIDTVPGLIPVAQDGDRLWGRGAVDAKGPLACFTAAAARVNSTPGWRVVVIGAVGEEGDSRGARYLCQQFPAPELVVIGEPSGWDRVTLGYKGSLWFEYTAVQPLAHTAASAGSACEGAVEFWNRFTAWTQAFNAGRGRVFEQISPSLRQMQSSEDGFSQTARLRIGMRIPDGVSIPSLVAEIRSLAGEARVEVLDAIPAYRAEKNTPLVRALLAGIRASGGQPGFTLKSGTSDMNLVAPAWRCPAAAYGPGDSNLDHTPEEHILISEYLAGIQVLSSALERIMQESSR